MKLSRVCLLAVLASFSAVTLSSNASAVVAACDGGILELRSGSEADVGWLGSDHNREISRGAGFGFAILRRCSDSSVPCDLNSDCVSNVCQPSCDCVGDTTCEITGPVGTGHCLNNLADCDSGSDCELGVSCVQTSSAPLPSNSLNVPICTVNYFDSDLGGTANVATGEVHLSATLRSRVFLGITPETPCPRCGAPGQDPDVGDTFTCQGGPNDGQTCHVDAVSSIFGGTSFDCPPSVASDVTGAGLTTRLDDLTTATTSRTAELPCKFFGFTGNPLNPGSNPKCLDDKNGAVCTSNADCRRCSLDASTKCSSNAECEGKGSCAEAPDQPITCGFWCHCGFCDGNASLPCFETSQCPQGQTCEVGPGSGTNANAPQQRANDCSEDGFICGGEQDEQCATDLRRCSENGFLACDTNSDCGEESAGVCEPAPHPCFGPEIARSGTASPLGTYCSNSGQLCLDNGDCPDASDVCLSNVLVPRLEALYCQGASASSAINSTIGLTGPAAITWNTRIQMCRCNVPEAACDELCAELPVCGSRPDDSPCSDGDPCTVGDKCSAGQCVSGDADPECTTTTTTANITTTSSTTLPVPQMCGDWNGDEEITTADALGVLQAAVGIRGCYLSVCDYNGDGEISVIDALAVLRASVDLPTSPSCPTVTSTT